MNLREIAIREENGVIDQDEAIYLVEKYIEVKKGVKVNISLDGIHRIFLLDQINKLTYAAITAGAYFREQK